MPRDDPLHLADIVEAVDAVQEYVAERTFEAFVKDDILRRAVLQRLIGVGAAAFRRSVEVRARHADVGGPPS